MTSSPEPVFYTSREAVEEKNNSVVDVISILDPSMDEDGKSTSAVQDTTEDKPITINNWERSQVDIISSDSVLVSDFNSVDSFNFTDSPDETISSQGTSSRSSQSSLSGMMFQSSTSNGGSSSSRSFRQSQGSHSRTGSASLSFISSGSKATTKSELNRSKSQCSKFNSRHNAGKVNYLRSTLLPFSRKHHLGAISHAASEIQYAQKVFAMWWSGLLEVSHSNFKHINGVDRDAFFEAISSLISRPEWNEHVSQNPYQHSLSETTNYVISKCSAMLSLSVSQSAFTGKVLAYAFHYIPGVSRYLLRLSRVPPSSVRRVLNGGSFVHSGAKLELLKSNAACFDALPSHLKSLIGLSETPDIPMSMRIKSSHIVNEHTQSWERHFTIDSAIFASFLKHYCSLQSRTLLSVDNQIGIEFIYDQGESQTVIYGEDVILSSPGMVLILAAISHSLDKVSNDTCRSLGPRNASPYSLRQPSINKAPSPNGAERVRIDQLKIFASVREILHSDDNTSPFFLAFSRTFDRVFRAIALETRVYDMSGCVTVCDLAEEWISSALAVPVTKASGIISPYKHLVIDWRFWLDVADRMLRSDNCHTEIRALSFLFNTWPHIPNQDISDPSISSSQINEEKSLIRDATEWAMSPEIWNRMFCHWSPLVRSYYQRFLCYRIASVGADNVSWYVDVDTSQYSSESRESLKQRLAESFMWCENLSRKAGMNPEVCPSLPMPRLRVGIRRFGLFPTLQSSKLETNLTRVYPFDVYDSVAYLQPEAVHEEPVSLSPVSERRSSSESTSSFRSITAAVQTESFRREDNDRISDAASTDNAQDDTAESSKNSPSSPGSPSKSELTRDDASDASGVTFKGKNRLTRKLSFVGSLRQFTGDSESNDKDFTRVENVPLDLPSNASSPDNNKAVTQDGSIKMQKPSSQKRFSFLRKLLPNRKSAPTAVENPGSTDHQNLTSKNSETHFQSKSILLHPPQLTQARPEISRSPFRFVMIPTSLRPPVRTDLASPRSPFCSDVCIQTCSHDLDQGDDQKDLAMWNYGGRSSAEWTIEVICFERFAMQQRQIVNDTLEMFPMPFMVTEIPWRTLG